MSHPLSNINEEFSTGIIAKECFLIINKINLLR